MCCEIKTGNFLKLQKTNVDDILKFIVSKATGNAFKEQE